MKKILISFIFAIIAMVCCSMLCISVMGYENFAIMQEKHLLSEDILIKQSQLWDKYWLNVILCFIPTFLAILNLAYQFYKEFTSDSFIR